MTDAVGRPAVAWGGLTGVLLDADDTVYDTRAAMHEAGAATAAGLWPSADPGLAAQAGVRFRDDPAGHFAAYTRGEVDFASMRRARVAELAAWLGQPVDDTDHDRFDALYEPAFLGALRPFPEVRGAVDRWRAAGLAVGILTNSSGAYTMAKLEAAGLADLVDVVCSRDTTGVGKPDAGAFHEACRRLGTDPAATLYVGDDLGADALGAADAGLPAVWLVRRDEDAPAARLAEVAARGIPVVSSLAELDPAGERRAG